LEMESNHLGAALGAEFGPSFKLATALGALVLGPEWFAAFRAELGSLGMCTTGRTQRRGFRGEVHTLGQVLLLEFLPHLLDGGLRLGGGQLGLNIGSALETQ